MVVWMKIAICVATYRRPQGLLDLLASLDAVRLPDDTSDIEIIVVDNSPEAGAIDLGREIRSRWPVRWVHEPRPGIPYARNAAVRAALPTADVLAFVDDDEQVTPDWLCAHLTHGHLGDILTGPVVPHLPPTAPAWATEGRFYERTRYPTGTSLPTCATNNSVVRREVFDCLPQWFDEGLDLTGGSDTDLFLRATLQGFSIRWVDSAVVTEDVPAERVSSRWLAARWFRRGATEGLMIRRYGRIGAVGAGEKLSRAVAHALRGLLRFLWGLSAGPVTRTAGLVEATHGAGVLWGVAGGRFLEYRR